MTILHLILATYALSFLAADARIFGVDATQYRELLDDPNTLNARKESRTIGILPLRWVLLRWKFFREHFSCYFCMGVWAGPLAHWLLWHIARFGAPWQIEGYFLDHPDTGWGWLLGCALAFLLGACGSYLLNVAVKAFEEHL